MSGTVQFAGMRAALACALLAAGALVAAAQITQESQPSQPETVVYEGKPLAEWAKALNDEDAETRLKAARALVAIGDPAYATLSEALSNPYQPVWKRTVESLVKIGKPAVPAMLAVMRLESSGDLRHNGGVAVIQQLGVAAHPALKKALDDSEPYVRMSAAVALRLQMLSPDRGPIIKLLAEVLQVNKDERVRLIAAESLGFPGPATDETVRALVAALQDSSADVQGQAAVSLVQLGTWRGHDVVPVLIKALSSKDEEGMLPQSAVNALGELGPAAEPAIPALIEMMKRNEPFLADYAAEALGKVGPGAVPALREVLKSGTEADRALAMKALGSAGPAVADTVPQLLEALKQGQPSVRAAAAKGLGEARASSDEVIAALINALSDEDRDIRWAAAHALDRIGSKAKAAVPALVGLLGKSESFEQGAVLRALGSIGPDAKEAIPAIVAEFPRAGLDASQTLARIGPAAVPALIEALQNENPDVREAAAWAVNCLGPDGRAAVPTLVKLVKVGEKACNFAIQALGSIGPDAAPATSALAVVVCDGDKTLRSWALDTLRRIGPGANEAKEAVRKLLADGDIKWRWDAMTTLAAIGDVDTAFPLLKETLRRVTDRDSYGVAMFLEEAGPKARSAVPVVVEVMENEKADMELRRQCAQTLTRIAPEDERGIAFLRKLAATPDEPASWRAAMALVEIGKADDATIARFKPGLSGRDPRGVVACAGALAQIASEREAAGRLLREKLQEKDPPIRVAAAIALTSAGIADPAAAEILAGELRKEDGSGREMEAVRALGKIARDDKQAHVILEEALHAESDAVRAAAREALRSSLRDVRLTPAEAKARIVSWYQARGETINYEERDAEPCEWTTDEIWGRLHVQVLVLGMQGYLVSREQVAALGGSFGGAGLLSICVSDLDSDGRPELLFTHSWGSGIHRSEVGAWSADWPAPGTVAALTEYTGFPDFTLQRKDDQHVEVRVDPHRLGLLRLEVTNGTPRLRIELDPDVPPAIRADLRTDLRTQAEGP